MTEVSNAINEWIAAGEPFALIAAGTLVAACFVIFNALRVFLYIPQIATCWRDRRGCPTINLYTWSSWLVANTSTGLYMWMFQSDVLGLCLNLGNAMMCAITVAITLLRRRQVSAGSDRRVEHDVPKSSVWPGTHLSTCRQCRSGDSLRYDDAHASVFGSSRRFGK